MGFVFEDARLANSDFVERIWCTHSERAGTFTSVAATNWEMVIATYDGKTMITARGPETKASEADFPADAEFFGITFKLGSFMPHLPLKALLDREDATLPEASSTSFWLHGSAWELPTFENADVFVDSEEPLEWTNSTLIKANIVEEITDLKQQDGKDITVHGSATLVQALMQHDLVDRYRLLVYPVVLGKGKRLFKEGIPATLKLLGSQSFSSGVVALVYEPDRQ